MTLARLGMALFFVSTAAQGSEVCLRNHVWRINISCQGSTCQAQVLNIGGRETRVDGKRLGQGSYEFLKPMGSEGTLVYTFQSTTNEFDPNAWRATIHHSDARGNKVSLLKLEERLLRRIPCH